MCDTYRNVEETIEIKPLYLHSNLDVVSIINNMKKGTCSDEYGYIIEITNVKILRIFVSHATTSTLAKLIFDVKSIKPAVKSKYKGKIHIITKTGVTLRIDNTFNVFIPYTKLVTSKIIDNYLIDISTQTKTHVGDIINIVITDIKYYDKQYQSIGYIDV